MDDTFFEAVKKRRTYYSIGSDSPVSDEKITDAIENALKYVPSAFNGQSARLVLLFGDAHRMLWSITKETLRKIVPEKAFVNTEKKMDSFAAGHGTVLYFDDTFVTESLAASFPSYKENFPIWAHQANGMLQFAIWTSLEQLGLGASIQHYNPLIDEDVKDYWEINKNWKLIAQMPFGMPLAEPFEKEIKPVSERMLTFNK